MNFKTLILFFANVITSRPFGYDQVQMFISSYKNKLLSAEPYTQEVVIGNGSLAVRLRATAHLSE